MRHKCNKWGLFGLQIKQCSVLWRNHLPCCSHLSVNSTVKCICTVMKCFCFFMVSIWHISQDKYKVDFRLWLLLELMQDSQMQTTSSIFDREYWYVLLDDDLNRHYSTIKQAYDVSLICYYFLKKSAHISNVPFIKTSNTPLRKRSEE